MKNLDRSTGSLHTTKRDVSRAKEKAYSELYVRLDGEKDLQWVASLRDQAVKDVQQIRMIKNRNGTVRMSDV